jgi:hypothetical protein
LAPGLICREHLCGKKIWQSRSRNELTGKEFSLRARWNARRATNIAAFVRCTGTAAWLLLFHGGMAANTLPSGIGELFQLAECMHTGLTSHGLWLLKGAVRAEEFAHVLVTAKEREAAFARARSKKAVAAKEFTSADAELTAWLAKARLVVMLALGSKWSESWLATGFTHRGTNVPKRIGPRMEVGRRLTEFFADQPQYEVHFAGVTAAIARELLQRIVAARNALESAMAVANDTKRARDMAERQLRRKMRSIRLLLSIPLKKTDSRWQVFGFNIPRPDATSVPRLAQHCSTDAEPLRIEFHSLGKDSEGKTAAA